MDGTDYAGKFGAPARTSNLALFSLIAAVVSYLFLPFIGAIAAVIMGHMALGEIRRSGGAMEGRGMAIAGLVLGYIQILLTILLVLLIILGIFFFLRVEGEQRTAMEEALVLDEAELVEAVEKKNVERALRDLGAFRRALDSFKADVGRYPTEGEGLSALLEKPEGIMEGAWKGPYLQELPRDPWANSYHYIPPSSQGEPYEVYSPGPDEVGGTEDDIR